MLVFSNWGHLYRFSTGTVISDHPPACCNQNRRDVKHSSDVLESGLTFHNQSSNLPCILHVLWQMIVSSARNEATRVAFSPQFLLLTAASYCTLNHLIVGGALHITSSDCHTVAHCNLQFTNLGGDLLLFWFVFFCVGVSEGRITLIKTITANMKNCFSIHSCSQHFRCIFFCIVDPVHA